MGVPITFLSSYNENEFEMLGSSEQFAKPIFIEGQRKTGRFYINQVRQYDRLLIKRKDTTSLYPKEDKEELKRIEQEAENLAQMRQMKRQKKRKKR